MRLFLSSANTVMLCSRCKIQRYSMYNCGTLQPSKYYFITCCDILIFLKEDIYVTKNFFTIEMIQTFKSSSSSSIIYSRDNILYNKTHTKIISLKNWHDKLRRLFCYMKARRLIRSSRPTEIFQPPQQGFFSVHAQLKLLGNIFQLFTPHPSSPQLTSHLTTLTLWFYI